MSFQRTTLARATRALLLLGVAMIAQRQDSVAQNCPPAPLLSTTEHAAAFGTWSTAIGDFTNDGKADVIATSLSGLLFFAGNGDGTLEPPTLSPQNEVGSIVTGYFDADLNLDFAVASGLQVFLGNGDGTFQDPVSYPGGTGQQERIASGYFNGDAHVDLVETDASGHQLWIYLSNGDGTFTPQPPVALSSSPVDVAVADFNGDGHADLAVALGAFDDTAFALLLGNGDGTFAAPVMVPAGIQQMAIAAADLDGDGKADVALGEPTGVVLLRGNGDATFQAPETFPTSGNPVIQVIAADVDGDGLLDLVGFQPGVVLEILQSAGHAFSMGPSLLAAGDRLSGVGDLNGDGLPDFSLHNFNYGIVELLLSTPGAYLAARSVAPGLEPQLLVAGDFDGDGQADLFVSGPSSGTEDSAVVLNEDDAFRIAWTASLGRISSGAAADLDGDGRADLALGGAGSSGLSIQFGLGDGTFSPGPVFNLNGPVGVSVADFNGDGIPDIATTSLGNGGVGELNVFLGQGAGTFQPVDPVELPDPTTSLASGDFDGDGVLDLVLTFSGYNGSNTIGVLFGNGDGTFRIGGSFLAGLDPFAVSVGDFNEDGHLDAVMANGGSTNVSLLLGDGAGGFAPVRLINVGAVPIGLAVADIDGDGHLDLATANSSAFQGGVSTSILLGDGAGAFLSPIVYKTAAVPEAVVTGAFGPGGRTGVAIAASNDWAVDVFFNGGLSDASASGPGTAIVGSSTALSVAATSGRPLAYQWRKGGVPLVDGGSVSGATSARLRIDPVSFDDAGSYDVVVSDSCSSATPNPSVLAVEFADVPVSSPFHADILTIATEGITSGCGGGNYCPTSAVRRDQMAVFLLKSEHGADYVPPACSGAFADVPCPSSFADWIEQLAAEGVTSGCGGGNFCPSSSVTRAQMAVFLLKTRDGSAYVPPPAVGIFGDVPVGSFGADFIEALYAAAITGGCQTSPLLYCPDNAVLRQQMATFLVRTFTP